MYPGNISEVVAESSTLEGYSIKQPLSVYQAPDRESAILKQYNYNDKLKFQPYTDNWYIATVYLNGIAFKGYIYKDDIAFSKDTSSVFGIARSNLTVYADTSTKTKKLKSYKHGSLLKFRNYNDKWYEATVYVSGKKHTGYIRHRDIELADHTQYSLEGIAKKHKTSVYSRASTNSKALKSYDSGRILKYRTFSKNWYEATVYIKGKRHTGYINKKDVESIQKTNTRLQGISNKHKTNVYSRASASSPVLKSYNYGSTLKYRALSDNWYEATVYIKGKPRTGYISKKDVSEQLSEQLRGFAKRDYLQVYSSTSRNSKTLKSYRYGSSLKYRYYNANWYIATVYVNGKKNIGFIHASDTSSSVKKLEAYALKDKTHVYSEANRKSKVLKSYDKGKLMKYLPHDNSWHKAVVYVKGKKQSGFIHVNDLGDKVPEEPVKELPILMYHQIGDNPSSNQLGQFVTEENFREQMTFLKDNGYTLINFEDIPNIHQYEKPIIVTFDDGRDNNKIAYEILSELQDESFNPKATFFIINNKINREGYLTEEEIKEMSDSNVISIQSHTMNHKHFNDSQVTDLDLYEELVESKQLLESMTGKEVIALAYPYGAVNKTVLEETMKHYNYAVTVKYGIATMNDPMHQLERVRVSFNTSIEEFSKMVESN